MPAPHLPAQPLATLFCPLLRSFSSYSKERRSVVSAKGPHKSPLSLLATELLAQHPGGLTIGGDGGGLEPQNLTAQRGDDVVEHFGGVLLDLSEDGGGPAAAAC